MPAPTHKPFSHRQNRDGSFDSICPRCFRTVATRSTESLLARDEFRHICLDWELDDGRKTHLLSPPRH